MKFTGGFSQFLKTLTGISSFVRKFNVMHSGT